MSAEEALFQGRGAAITADAFSHELIVILLQLVTFLAMIAPVIQGSIRVLQAQGYKVTRPRRQVLGVLEEAQKSLSPYDIQRVLRQRGKYLNHVTIYRILNLFCRLNLAHKVLSAGGFVKCILDKKEGCHRLLFCRCCGALQEFADDELCQRERKLAQDSGFHTEYHLSESSGICSDCSKKQ